MISPCGMFCTNCIRFKALDDDLLQRQISEKMGIPASDSSCPGCRRKNREERTLSEGGPCLIFQCAEKKRLEYCCDCNAFPCEQLLSCSCILSDDLANVKIINLSILRDNGEERLKSTVCRLKKFSELIPNCPQREPDRKDREEPQVDIIVSDLR